jgi:hypothetical protein
VQVWSASVAIIAINSKAINVPSFDIPYSYLIYPPVRHRSTSYSPRRRRCLIPYNAGYCECFLRFISPTSMQPISTTSPKSPHCLYSSLYIPSPPNLVCVLHLHISHVPPHPHPHPLLSLCTYHRIRLSATFYFFCCYGPGRDRCTCRLY